ncbi:TSL-kinase interacting protein 1-like isoform X2 [Magnolia sinica]|uniref:TSL-kinase interacting protein 1-like isoform X2 n=1 Tax=Magnolia sinica TaxID=86752 RepID=UPI002658FD99|nr:TSL-kinase interacting protein 1-like isoform X2 [Magnolia sinica]XP_058102167.1 TSL-kinase interacting protein 1-like isoform X2 [Magnolia sinica]XP_058102168.1 TSL-kinase interacting protein 1-like isoform X2 [Magnolia sinica]XP_058102169.1 TSL-kinase interacting protein 1-like isoform X2 [Magnolia sinica]XP_058102170.1 TSL-kinase interacting protein 1-like isoform X2 [Magnolia sinica]
MQNFNKITCRVQSKNKDQVRHYYYRLVRRMNKLLGPGFSLDIKNTKDTISAMLRWWSLLEKYSCTSSKLHLKPRRFKIFVKALENQLLKDRKKTQKKRPSLGENCSSTPSTAVPLLNKAEGNDAHAVKLLIVDGQNIQKVGCGKAASLKRSAGMNISCNKSDLSSMKTSRQRRRTVFLAMKEHRLLKDCKKTQKKQTQTQKKQTQKKQSQKKRPSLGENCSSTPSTAVPLLNKAEGNDAHAVKLLIVDGQNIQKVGSGKAASLKHSVSMNISCNKSDLSSMKTSRQRRRTGI